VWKVPQQLEQKLLRMTWLRTLLPGGLSEQSALLWLLSDHPDHEVSQRVLSQRWACISAPHLT
jgi:hypothetical protein